MILVTSHSSSHKRISLACVDILKYNFILCAAVSELHLLSCTLNLNRSIKRGKNQLSGNVDGSSCERRVSWVDSHFRFILQKFLRKNCNFPDEKRKKKSKGRPTQVQLPSPAAGGELVCSTVWHMWHAMSHQLQKKRNGTNSKWIERFCSVLESSVESINCPLIPFKCLQDSIWKHLHLCWATDNLPAVPQCSNPPPISTQQHFKNTLTHKGRAGAQNMTDGMQPVIFNKRSDSSDWWAPNESADRSISLHRSLLTLKSSNQTSGQVW